MGVRHPSSRSPAAPPTLWLVTDERQGAALWAALDRLPRGSGVLFRHHRTARADRAALFARVASRARQRDFMIVREEDAAPRIARIHSLREAMAARRRGAAWMFVSPVFATRTHPGAATLGPLRAARIARLSGMPAIALGGMSAHRFRRMQALGFVGWAAIDALTPHQARDQKRNAVPI